jgi:hypothetical protein
MATTTPNFGWSVPTSSDLVKNGAVAIETLGDSIDASLVDLKGGTTGQVLAKATNTDMDFTWTTAASGGGMTLLSTTTLSGTSTTISSISGSYKHLLVVVKGAYATNSDTITLQFNGVTTSNYGNRMFRVTGTTVDATTSNNSYIRVSEASSNTDWSNVNNGEFWVWRYTDTSNITVSSKFAGYDGSAKTGTINEGRFNASAAVTSITLGLTAYSFSAGTVYVYGVN